MRRPVKALLKQRADVNVADVDGSTALQWAAHWNDLDTVKALLAAGAKANVPRAATVCTPLHEAAANRQRAIVNALAPRWAAADSAYGEGETPLMLAAAVWKPRDRQAARRGGANGQRGGEDSEDRPP
jgi:ankyrin repeat protein